MKKLVIYGNCQINPIYDIINKHHDFQAQYKRIGPTEPVHMLNQESQINTLKQAVTDADIFIYQNISSQNFGKNKSTEYLLELAKDSCISISIPNCFYQGLHPSFNYINHAQLRGGKQFCEYHDYLIIYGYLKGLSTFNLIEFLKNFDQINEGDLIQHAENSMKQLKQREESTLIKISDYIEEKQDDNVLFHTFNHPTNKLL